MTNKLLLSPLLLLKLKTAVTIKSGLSLFGLGLGFVCVINSPVRREKSIVGTQTYNDESPTTKPRARHKPVQQI
jgi:hypothetical protein